MNLDNESVIFDKKTHSAQSSTASLMSRKSAFNKRFNLKQQVNGYLDQGVHHLLLLQIELLL